MNLSIWLLTTALSAGGPADMPVEVTAQTTPVPQQVIYSSSPAPMMYPAQPQRRGLLSRIGGLFHRDAPMMESAPSAETVVYTSAPSGQVVAQPLVPVAAPVVTMTPVPAVTTAEPPRAEPIQPVAHKEAEAEVKKEFQKKVGHADDYTWITGQLFYVHADGGMWVLRFASVGEEDRYGGSAVLAPAVDMKNFREGDLVSVSGEVLDQGRASRHLGGCLYRAAHIELIERAD